MEQLEKNDAASFIHRHSKVMTGFFTLDETLHWRYNTRNLSPRETENAEVKFFVLMRSIASPQKEDALREVVTRLEKNSPAWLVVGRQFWAFDLDLMKQEFEDLRELDWFTGRVHLEPEFEVRTEGLDITKEKYFETSIIFYINREATGMSGLSYPPEIQRSIQEFRLDYPDPLKVAFIMMKFGNTDAHIKVVKGIKDALSPHGITAVRADEKEYNADLFPNILTYLFGCGFGIAVFERIERDDFNPNVSLEVGYMMAMGKHVCLLKDMTLPSLHTDLVGRLYRPFDPQNAEASIPPQLTSWMKDKRLI
ncbi:MAG: hypothetical protein ACKVQJ_02965 [Pyrinomonadaceae bacterium]